MSLSALLAAALLQATTPAPVATIAAIGMPPPVVAWATLPELRYRRRLPQPDTLARFVRAEVTAGRCVLPADAVEIAVDLILYVDANGLVRRIVPRAILCPTVEQYAAGLGLRMARDNVVLPDAPADAWYRTRIVFPLK